MINVYRNKLKRLKSKQTKQNSNPDNKFETMFKQEKAALIARSHREQDTMRDQFQHADQRHADTANLRLETARK